MDYIWFSGLLVVQKAFEDATLGDLMGISNNFLTLFLKQMISQENHWQIDEKQNHTA